MGWETRRNGRYYYRKRREGGRVVSEYVGTGELAAVLAEVDQTLARERAQERELERAELRELQDLDRKIDAAAAGLRLLTRAVLLAGGYHTHRGQWRKRRDDRESNGPG